MATILIAENRPVERERLAKVLFSGGHHVHEASDGLDALEIAQRERPHMIISDVLMPTMDGFEFVRRLRTIDEVRDTPVVFYTATYHQREARALAKQCGVSKILVKPSDSRDILAIVDGILSADLASSAVLPSLESFDHEHERLLNTKLMEKVNDLEAAEQRLAVVLEICQAFVTQHDPIAILRNVCKSTRDVTFAQHSVVGLVGADGSAVEMLLTCGYDEETERSLKPPPRTSEVLRTVVAERLPIRKRNVDGRPEALGLPEGQPAIHSFLAVPIASPSRVYGWLSAHNKLGADEFSDADKQVALILAAHAAVAYENVRMIDDLQHQATAMTRSEERKQFALGVAHMGVWELDLISNELTWSETMAPVFGITPEEAPTSKEAFFALIHPADRRALEDSFDAATREGASYELEFRAVWPDGSEHWVAGQVQLLRDGDGNPTRLLGVGMDIHERKSLEAQFRQAQKMDAVGQLAGGVAHDFNNLLTAIIGYSNFVLETFESEDSRREDIEQVLKAGERAAALTRQLLAFSRKQVLQPTSVDLNALVSGMRQMLSRTMGEQVNLVTTLAPNLGAVRADPGQLEQVLMNLVVNARDAMPSGGRLSVETANVDLDESYAMKHTSVRPGQYVMLAVSDSGIGMEEETKRHLFEPFFTTKLRGQGTGLGLATVYGIVKQSGGHIWVYSESGKGATFKVYLPRTDRDEHVKTSTPPNGATLVGTETVLVVEDERAVRLLMRVILERAGYKVFDAANPAQAEALFNENVDRYDLLVTDVIMPGSSGPDLFARLTRKRPGLKVLYVSGYTDDTIVHQGQLLPGVEFLQKPFTADALNRKVREVLEK